MKILKYHERTYHISSNDSDILPNEPLQTTSKSSCENTIKYQAISKNKSILFCVSRRVWRFGFGIQASCLNFGTSKIGCSTCSQQLRFVEVDPEEDCRAKGDDENCPAKLQQCVARVASMCNFRDGQHCSGKRSCLGYPIFWHCLHLTSSSFWSGDKCHVGKTKKCQAHSHHQKRRGATSHGECQTAKLQILPLNCSVLSQSCARCILLICSHGVSQALRWAHYCRKYMGIESTWKSSSKIAKFEINKYPTGIFFWGYVPFTVIIAAFAES